MFKYAYDIHSLMKLQFAIVLGVILIGSIATVNMAFVQNNEFSANSIKNTAGMMGHITLTAVNEDGNIIAYRQTDNVIVNSGDDCIAQNLFGTSFSCNTATAPYTTIVIGNDSVPVHVESDTSVTSYQATTGGTLGQASTAQATSGAFITVTAAFLNVSANIAEAALRNNAESALGDTLALNEFSTIILGTTDSLTIDWTITVDGS